MFSWVPFAAAVLVLIWALGSFAMAATGGERAGLHEVQVQRRRADENRWARRERTYQLYAVMNYLLALAILAATIALFGAAIFL